METGDIGLLPQDAARADAARDARFDVSDVRGVVSIKHERARRDEDGEVALEGVSASGEGRENRLVFVSSV